MPGLELDGLSIPVPIVQGGMGVAVSMSGLAGAVSAAGGLGVIASIGLRIDDERPVPRNDVPAQSLRQEIRKVKDRGLPVGVNIMAAASLFSTYVQISMEEGADVIFSGAGLPLTLPDLVPGSGPGIAPIVSSGRAAAVLCRYWWKSHRRVPDAVVVEGPMAGGHLGFRLAELEDGSAPTLESIVVDVLAELRTFEVLAGKPIPVIAAGGVYSGGDIARMLDIGASAVQMGTRFVATVECDAPEQYKQAYLDASADDVAVVQSPLGVPARILLSGFVERTKGARGVRVSCKHACLKSCDAAETGYCIANAMVAAANGDFANGFAMCGQNVYRVDKIVLVDELMATLVAEATRAQDASEYRRQSTTDGPRERILVART